MSSKQRFVYAAVDAADDGRLAMDDYDFLTSQAREAEDSKVPYLSECLRLVISKAITSSTLRDVVSRKDDALPTLLWSATEAKLKGRIKAEDYHVLVTAASDKSITWKLSQYFGFLTCGTIDSEGFNRSVKDANSHAETSPTSTTTATATADINAEQVKEVRSSLPPATDTSGRGCTKKFVEYATSLYGEHEDSALMVVGGQDTLPGVIEILIDVATAANTKYQTSTASAIATGRTDTSGCCWIHPSTPRPTRMNVAPSVLVLVPNTSVGRLFNQHMTSKLRLTGVPLAMTGFFADCDAPPTNSDSPRPGVDIAVMTVPSWARLDKSRLFDFVDLEVVLWIQSDKVLAPSKTRFAGDYERMRDNTEHVRRLLQVRDGRARHIFTTADKRSDMARKIRQTFHEHGPMSSIVEIGMAQAKRRQESRLSATVERAVKRARMGEETSVEKTPPPPDNDGPVRTEPASTAPDLAYAVKIDLRGNTYRILKGDRGAPVFLCHELDREQASATARKDGQQSNAQNVSLLARSPQPPAADKARSAAVTGPNAVPLGARAPRTATRSAGPIPRKASIPSGQASSTPAAPATLHTAGTFHTLATIPDDKDICPSQTIDYECDRHCTLIGICWLENKGKCDGRCGKIHGRPCIPWLVHAGSCNSESRCGLSHDPRWKKILSRREKHQKTVGVTAAVSNAGYGRTTGYGHETGYGRVGGYVQGSRAAWVDNGEDDEEPTLPVKVKSEATAGKKGNHE